MGARASAQKADDQDDVEADPTTASSPSSPSSTVRERGLLVVDGSARTVTSMSFWGNLGVGTRISHPSADTSDDETVISVDGAAEEDQDHLVLNERENTCQDSVSTGIVAHASGPRKAKYDDQAIPNRTGIGCCVVQLTGPITIKADKADVGKYRTQDELECTAYPGESDEFSHHLSDLVARGLEDMDRAVNLCKEVKLSTLRSEVGEGDVVGMVDVDKVASAAHDTTPSSLKTPPAADRVKLSTLRSEVGEGDVAGVVDVDKVASAAHDTTPSSLKTPAADRATSPGQPTDAASPDAAGTDNSYKLDQDSAHPVHEETTSLPEPDSPKPVGPVEKPEHDGPLACANAQEPSSELSEACNGEVTKGVPAMVDSNGVISFSDRAGWHASKRGLQTPDDPSLSKQAQLVKELEEEYRALNHERNRLRMHAQLHRCRARGVSLRDGERTDIIMRHADDLVEERRHIEEERRRLRQDQDRHVEEVALGQARLAAEEARISQEWQRLNAERDRILGISQVPAVVVKLTAPTGNSENNATPDLKQRGFPRTDWPSSSV